MPPNYFYLPHSILFFHSFFILFLFFSFLFTSIHLCFFLCFFLFFFLSIFLCFFLPFFLFILCFTLPSFFSSFFIILFSCFSFLSPSFPFSLLQFLFLCSLGKEAPTVPSITETENHIPEFVPEIKHAEKEEKEKEVSKSPLLLSIGGITDPRSFPLEGKHVLTYFTYLPVIFFTFFIICSVFFNFFAKQLVSFFFIYLLFSTFILIFTSIPDFHLLSSSKS